MKIINILFVFFFSIQICTANIDQFVVFGDSLSDNGNLYEYMKHQLPISPPYYEGRFTNGPVWIELLTEMYYPDHGSEHLLDFAFGGAGVLEPADDDDVLFSLNREIDSYLLAHQDKASPNSLYFIWIGSNNYLGIPDDIESAVDVVNRGIVSGVNRLIEKGAKSIIVLNLPNLGKTPIATDFDAVDVLTQLSMRNNEVLAENMLALQEKNPDKHLLLYDLNAALNEILNNPKPYGFNNINGTCYEELIDNPSSQSVLQMVSTVKPHLTENDVCTGYLFFDPVHPTAPAHLILAEKIKLFLENTSIFH